MLLIALALALVLQTAAPTTDQTIAMLRAKDQALLDAIAPGDKKVWEQALASDAVYVDESGTILDRAHFLNSSHPCPRALRARCGLQTIRRASWATWRR